MDTGAAPDVQHRFPANPPIAHPPVDVRGSALDVGFADGPQETLPVFSERKCDRLLLPLHRRGGVRIPRAQVRVPPLFSPGLWQAVAARPRRDPSAALPNEVASWTAKEVLIRVPYWRNRSRSDNVGKRAFHAPE